MTPAQIEAYVDAAAAALDLRLRPDHRAGVLRYFALAAEFAAVVEAVPLDPHDETGGAFLAGAADGAARMTPAALLLKDAAAHGAGGALAAR